MPPEAPKIDSQTYEQLLQNVLARVRVHNPEWTNLSESDPGVTILELFAYLTVELTQRANEIPDRNRRKFLSLLGVPLQPAVPAQGVVTFQNERKPPVAMVIPPDTEVRAGQVPFRTRCGLEALPVDAVVCYKAPVDQPASVPAADVGKLYGLPPGAADTRYYQTKLLEAPTDSRYLPVCDLIRDTVDQCLWVALLARPKDDIQAVREAVASRTLSLGILPAPPASRRLAPRQGALSPVHVPLLFEVATNQYDLDGQPVYRPLPASLSGNPLQEPGIAALRLPEKDQLSLWQLQDARLAGTGDLPPLLPDPKQNSLVVTWIRVRFPGEFGQGFDVKLNWVGINSDMVIQQVHVAGELLGRGNGEPNQGYTLVHKGVVKGSVQLTVNGEPWQEIDDIRAAGPEVPLRDLSTRPGFRAPARPSKVFQVDLESGAVTFGDGAHGARPRGQAEIRASYSYGGGRAGNLEIGQINKAPSFPPTLKVKNPLPTWGGADAQTTEEAELQLSSYLKHRDRLVTADDFLEIIRDTPGVEMGRVEVLPLFHPDQPSEPKPGTVTVMVVPQPGDGDPAPPEPDRRFLDVVCAEVEARRLITTEVVVRGPQYKRLQISVSVEVEAGRSFPPVREAVNAAMRAFLSPVTGGHSQKGWPLQKSVRSKELLAVADRVDGVAYVTDVTLRGEDGAPVDEVPLSGLELPWPSLVDVRQGDPATGGSSAPALPARRVIPVPVIPQQ